MRKRRWYGFVEVLGGLKDLKLAVDEALGISVRTCRWHGMVLGRVPSSARQTSSRRNSEGTVRSFPSRPAGDAVQCPVGALA